VAPPEPGDPAAELEPLDELQPKNRVPATNKDKQPRVETCIAFRVLVRITSSMVPIRASSRIRFLNALWLFPMRAEYS
jgi:hypothetical protein